MARKATVYRLRDPRDMAIRYIGVTVSAIETRVSTHLTTARYDHKGINATSAWLRQLIDLDMRPVAEAIDVVEGHLADERERYLIAVHRAEGHRLTNFERAPRYQFYDPYAAPAAD